MNTNLSDITVVIDRSGSMESCKVEAVGGLNAFVEDQKKLPGSANFTLIQFDDRYEVVHAGVPIQSVGKLDLIPRGWTALYDAVGRAVRETGERLSAMPENERPGLVVFVIITDGMENASKEFRSKAEIKKIIDHQTQKYNWKFLFLGSNQDGFAEGTSLGMSASATYSNTKGAIRASSNNVSRMRCAVQAVGFAPSCEYTQEELDMMVS